MLELGQLNRSCANGARAKSCARSIGHRIVIGNAADHDINIRKITAIATAPETQRTAIGHFRPPLLVATGPERLITAFVSHISLPSLNYPQYPRMREQKPKSKSMESLFLDLPIGQSGAV